MSDMSDPISRQQTITALRALSDEDGYINAPHEVVTDVVRGLPPVRAEHEQTTRSEQGDSDKFGVKTGETCEDCISRQAAIDALGEKPLAWTEGEYELGLQNQWQSDVDALKALPSAQPVLTCDGCRHVGTYDTDFPCNGCVRREKDYYDPER